MKKNDKNIFIVVTHIIKKENNQYVAICPEFDVSSFGDTVEEANENLKEAITLYLEGIDELKIRDQVFKEKSIKTYTGRPKSVEMNKYKFEKGFDNQPFIKKEPLQVALCK
ncbi:MAG TPA: type II toxin-antitoxin system HicB family antitoxin [Atribacterota bacterium]|nr:type II toxin-antitoxin system HicB family antitoxin [Atribacterota bacterium]